ncbi:MAG TPA: hypothetical protein VGA47_10290 [Candidatus Dormibacteraeota bacterium]
MATFWNPMTMSWLGMAHSAPSTAPRSSAGMTSPPASVTTDTPIVFIISMPRPEVRNRILRRSSRLLDGRLNQPSGSQ